MPLRALGNWYFRGPAFGDPQEAFQKVAPVVPGLLDAFTDEQQREMGQRLQKQLRSLTPRSQIIQPFQKGLLEQQQSMLQQQQEAQQREQQMAAFQNYVDQGIITPETAAFFGAFPEEGAQWGRDRYGSQIVSEAQAIAQRDAQTGRMENIFSNPPRSVQERNAFIQNMREDPDFLQDTFDLQAAEKGPMLVGAGSGLFSGLTGEQIAAQLTTRAQEAALGVGEEDPSTTAMRTRQAMIEDYMRNNPGMTYNQAADLVDKQIGKVVDPSSGRMSTFNPREFVLGDPQASRFVQQAQPIGGYELPEWTQGGASLGTEGAIPSTGISGAAKTLANQIFGAVGGKEPFPEAAQFVAVAERLKTDSTMRMAEGYAGRPSNFVVQKFDSLSADPRKIMQGDEGLYRDLREFRNLVERDRSMTEAIARDPYSIDIRTHQDSLLKLRNLNDVAADYDAILELMEAVMANRGMRPRTGSAGQPMELELPPEVLDYLQREGLM
jgi:hypothetical protein